MPIQIDLAINFEIFSYLKLFLFLFSHKYLIYGKFSHLTLKKLVGVNGGPILICYCLLCGQILAVSWDIFWIVKNVEFSATRQN